MQTVPTSTPLPVPALRGLTPNQYVLGGRNTRVEYSATSITGAPLLHYQDATHDVHARGEEIRRNEAELGTLVSVTLEPDADAGSLLLTVLIPRARLRDAGGEIPITTDAVLTRTRLLPRIPSDTQLQTYQIIALQGTASFVVS